MINEKKLGKDLLNLDATEFSGVADVHQQTWRVPDRDRRRVRLLTGLTITVWLISASLIFAVLVAFGLLFPQQAKFRQDVERGKVTLEQRERIQDLHFMAFEKGTLLIAFSVAILGFAALCTVLLNFASRRATLRQINASLMEISEQLKQLRQSVPPPA